jgi:hypothetical protein
MCYEVAVEDWGWQPSEFWNASPQEFYAVLHRKKKKNAAKATPGSVFSRKEVKEMLTLIKGGTHA